FVLFRLEFSSGAGADLMLFKPEFGSVFQVGVSRTNNTVSPLSPPGGRGGKGAERGLFKA
ncbi:hypothetical protein, partial [Pseudomonas syringae]|uniref:hypothetical protein n=1 Tax=Pseudomonas syringae TaxID=317 RepID=UPI001F38A431